MAPGSKARLLVSVDGQVKIRGHRVELGEIEAALRRQSGVSEAVVVARENKPDGGVHLIGYVVPEEGASVAVEELLNVLGHTLPHYMVPTAILALDSLPLDRYGNVDRKTLLAAELSSIATKRQPETALEMTLCDAFAEVTGASTISLHDDFFDCGGDSLMGLRLINLVYARLGVELPLEVIFEAGTPAGIAEWVRGQYDCG